MLILKIYLKFSEDSDIGYFTDCDLSYPDNMMEKKEFFNFAAKIK